MKNCFFIIFLFARLALAIDQQAYLDCKETAFKNLATRYQQNFTADTSVVGAKPTAEQYLQDYKRDGKQSCENLYVNVKAESQDIAAYQKCLDGALNGGVSRFADYLPTSLGITNNPTALETASQYQKDYTTADEKCRSQYLDNSDTCTQQSKAAVEACDGAKKTAVISCDPTQDAGLNSVKSASDNITKSSGSGSVQQSCSTANKTTADANSALANYQSNCSSAKKSCTDQCSQAKQAMLDCSKSSNANAQSTPDFQSTSTNGDTCSMLEAKVEQANQAVREYSTVKNDSANCKSDTSGQPGGDAKPAGDSGAQAAATPAAAQEAKMSVPDASTASAAGASGEIPLRAPAAVASPINLPGASTPSITNFTNAPSSSVNDVGGKQGGGANLGGSSAGIGGEGSTNSKISAKAANKLDAYAGASGFSGGGGSGGGSAFATSRSGSANRSGLGALKKNGGLGDSVGPDLRSFLPGGARDPKLGLAGMTGPDGITGPNSSLWGKITNRYQMMTTTLLP